MSYKPFEGCEKKLTLIFGAVTEKSERYPGSLRSITEAEWREILKGAQCTIRSSISNEQVDAYLLSESSLFVFDRKVLLKTCGTTTPLGAVEAIRNRASNLGLELSYAEYTRSEFMFPTQQRSPHTSFMREVEVLLDMFPGGAWEVFGKEDREPNNDRGMRGSLKNLGCFCNPSITAATPLSENSSETSEVEPWPEDYFGRSDFTDTEEPTTPPGTTLRGAWYLYSWGHRPPEEGCVLDVAMFDLDPEDMAPFFQSYHFGKSGGRRMSTGNNYASTEMRRAANTALEHSGLYKMLLNGAKVDNFLFEPCGYSLNAIKDGYYWSVHVTPEEGDSFVSYETNCPEAMNVGLVLEIFRPKRYKTCVYSHDEGLDQEEGTDDSDSFFATGLGPVTTFKNVEVASFRGDRCASSEGHIN